MLDQKHFFVHDGFSVSEYVCNCGFRILIRVLPNKKKIKKFKHDTRRGTHFHFVWHLSAVITEIIQRETHLPVPKHRAVSLLSSICCCYIISLKPVQTESMTLTERKISLPGLEGSINLRDSFSVRWCSSYVRTSVYDISVCSFMQPPPALTFPLSCISIHLPAFSLWSWAVPALHTCFWDQITSDSPPPSSQYIFQRINITAGNYSALNYSFSFFRQTFIHLSDKKNPFKYCDVSLKGNFFL